VHDWIFLALLVVVIGHIGKALADPTALKGMISGRVTRGWARRNRPRWLEELERDSNRAPIE
jgi:formate dehydrogenase subunit gamma